jgi:hypothetical protein
MVFLHFVRFVFEGEACSMTKNNDSVPVLALRRLLHDLKDLRPDIGVRFRLIGEMWQPNHTRIIQLTEKGVALNDERSNKLIFVRDLLNVMQFELDRTFQQYQPHFHYNVNPVLAFWNTDYMAVKPCSW